ncbi:ZPR1 zinc-finger domain-containing protein [Pisolithus thermaeus]|nr:ZPR1 zinc-finger domain-containing protein [Pisolithus thermaeus]
MQPEAGTRRVTTHRVAKVRIAGENSGYETVIRHYWTRDCVEAISEQLGKVTQQCLWPQPPRAMLGKLLSQRPPPFGELSTSSHGSKPLLYSTVAATREANSNKDRLQVLSEVQAGILYTLKVLHGADLNRQIIQPEACTVKIPDFELQFPLTRGQLATVGGLLCDIAAELISHRPIIDANTETLGDEKEVDELTRVTSVTEKHSKDFVKKAITINLTIPWETLLSNSFETYRIPSGQESSTEQMGSLEEKRGVGVKVLGIQMKRFTSSWEFVRGVHVHQWYRDNDVKSGAAISGKGNRITLRIEEPNDLSRDILKTCGLTTPEIDLALQPGTLGGRFTTVEGTLEQVHEELSEMVYTTGDSSTMVDEDRQKFQGFLKPLKEITNAERPFALILDDPLANSYLPNLYAPCPDPNMDIVTYERTWQQNEEMGLDDMKVENYTAEDVNEPKEKGFEEVAS